MSGPASYSNPALDPVRLPERALWMKNLHVPRFLKRLLPPLVKQGLRELKGRFVTRELPRHIEFAQSPEDRQASASMSIVVPIHDAPMTTLRCLASLEKYAPESEVILVDDGSRFNKTLEVIEAFSGRNGWKVIHHEKALGHSAACGAGSRLATRPYICLLNSDTVVTPWCWRRVKEVFEQNQEIGVAGPSTSCSGTVQTLSSLYSLRIYLNDNQICAFANQLLTEFQEPVVRDLAWVSGFAFFIRRGLWEQLGGFDPNLPDYGNEVELCSRVTEKGYRCVWVGNCYVHHLGEQSYSDTIGEEGIGARIRAAELYLRQKKHSLTQLSR